MKGSHPKTATSVFAQKMFAKAADAKSPKSNAQHDDAIEAEEAAQPIPQHPARPSRIPSRNRPGQTAETEYDGSREIPDAALPKSPQTEPSEISDLDPSEVGVEKSVSLQRTSSHARKVRMGDTKGKSSRRRFAGLWVCIVLVGLAAMGLIWVLIVPSPTPLPMNPPGGESEETAKPGEEASGTSWSLTPGPLLLGTMGDALKPPHAGQQAEKSRMARSREILATQGPKAALQAAEAEASARPNDAAAQHHAGVMAMAANEPVKARAYFRFALAINASAAASSFNLAQAEFEIGDYAEAQRLLQTFLARDPTHKVATYRALLCALLLQQEAALNPLALPEDSLPGLYARAAMAHTSGDDEAAQAFLERARLLPIEKRFRFESDMKLLGLE